MVCDLGGDWWSLGGYNQKASSCYHLIFSTGKFAQFFAYHIVFTMGLRRIFLSRVTKARPSARAVAAIIRSAGSAEKSPGNPVESVDTFRKGRVLRAGDAAHINNPMGALGINSGISVRRAATIE